MAISDNFKTFVGAELKQFLSGEGISWDCILSKSPWWGSFYERLIRIVKEAVKKCIGNAKLRYEELETVLVDIEGIINSRPLTYQFDEVDEALTPSHLAVGRRLINNILKNETPAEPTDMSNKSLNARYRYLQSIINDYWKRFSNEYLTTLHQHHLDNHKGKYDELFELLLDDIVLIKDDKSRRNMWQKGRILPTDKR